MVSHPMWYKIVRPLAILLMVFPLLLSAERVPDDFILVSDPGSVNWSKGEILASGRAKIPEVVKNPDDFKYDPNDPNQPRNQAQARLLAKARARDAAVRNAAALIQNLTVNNGKKLSEYMKNENINNKVNSFINENGIIKDLAVSDSETAVTLSYQIFGANGLLSLNRSGDFRENFINFEYEEMPVLQMSNSQSYAGLVISASYLKLTPALAPRIFSEDGKLIYDSSYVLPQDAIASGVVTYAKTPFGQPKDVNLNYYHCAAIDTKTPMGSDIIIANEDALNLLSHNGTRMNLRKCRVIILASDENK
jgi:hypothetical protein